jgi:hypothetical protein
MHINTKHIIKGEKRIINEGRKNKPALHEVGGSFCKSFSSFKIRFEAISSVKCSTKEKKN